VGQLSEGLSEAAAPGDRAASSAHFVAAKWELFQGVQDLIRDAHRWWDERIGREAGAMGLTLKGIRLANLDDMANGVRRSAAMRMVAIGGLALVAAGCAAPSRVVNVVSPASPSHTFTPSTITAPPGEPFRIIYRNDDSGAEHNIAIYDHEGGREIVASTNIVGPNAATELIAPALSPGTYFVQCDIHPFMTATLLVRQSSTADPGDASTPK
jgi:plastocyanin